MKIPLPGPIRTAVLGGLLALLASSAIAAPFSLVAVSPHSLTPAALTAAQRTVTLGQIALDKKTLTFGRKIVRLVAVTGPDNDMLSYRIDGLRNPTLVVPRGATLKVLFANTDDDMFHDLRFGTARKTYPNAMDPLFKSSVGTPPLPHKSETALHAEELILRIPSARGTYAYFCTVRGHAQGGMVGKVEVK